QEIYPYHDPLSLPIEPVLTPSGEWLQVPLELPGRRVLFRIWQARVGRFPLYLLDSNDPLNGPADRGITSKLYGGGTELRLLQEIVLGIAGWRLLQMLGLEVEVCHLNEGHAAFVVLERARCYAIRNKLSFWEAFWATRAGNVFTSHTPVAAGFDLFPPQLMAKYFQPTSPLLPHLGLTLEELLALGRKNAQDAAEPFNMAYLAMRGCITANGVSALHETVSRQLFAPLFPRWPIPEVPVGHVTNGVHVPTWDSRWTDRLWSEACGKGRWLGSAEELTAVIEALPDEVIWKARAEERADLVRYARARLARQIGQRGGDPEAVAQAQEALDPDALTLGFARRFTAYKRPNLLLYDRQRLIRLLNLPGRPVQIIVAGKAHPEDTEGKRLLQAWMEFLNNPAVRRRVVFLEDYDMSLAQELVEGVDVWINTPRRPWEASGTSGMKVLVNGGLNLSELDGWWAEAYSPEVGWALGDGQEHDEPDWDAREAEQLYRLLEEDIIPTFYNRDERGLPRHWIARIRASMARLTPRFSTNRMLREYLEKMYLPAASTFRRRTAEQGRLARELSSWWSNLCQNWNHIRFGALETKREENAWIFRVFVELGSVSPEWVRVEIYADPEGKEPPFRQSMLPEQQGSRIANGVVYTAKVQSPRPSTHFTPRAIPYHPEAQIPTESNFIVWHR
ncbi:MAG: alpha-glucan family phosphorylase, partial [Gemmatales bacterium]|nr:alpha-glucan family phosphorylase [Gemmatales bacterium]MDW8388035.1 alpha-glucan family phosphorylase [Gemmatales bacterium]